MPRRRVIDGVAQSLTEGPDVPPMPKAREVIYTILVPQCNDLVTVDRTKRLLRYYQISERLIYVHPASTDDEGTFWPGHVSVPRLFTLWQSDALEAAWQERIKAVLPDAQIWVKDWTPAPGYPMETPGWDVPHE